MSILEKARKHHAETMRRVMRKWQYIAETKPHYGIDLKLMYALRKKHPEWFDELSRPVNLHTDVERTPGRGVKDSDYLERL